MTDFRALCAELVEKLDELNCNFNVPNQSALIERSCTALAQPEPQVPTDEELLGIIDEIVCWAQRQALARWGRFAIEPVPVSERLPGPEDCNAEGCCWLLTVEDDYPQWRLHSIQGAQPGGEMIWVPVDNDNGAMLDCFYTSHWLPHHALPVPKVNNTGKTND